MKCKTIIKRILNINFDKKIVIIINFKLLDKKNHTEVNIELNYLNKSYETPKKTQMIDHTGDIGI